MAIQYKKNEVPATSLIGEIFPRLKEEGSSPHYITGRAILATQNEFIDMMNNKLIESFPGKECRYTSYDQV